MNASNNTKIAIFDSSSDKESEIVAQNVHLLMDKNHIPQRSHAKELAKILSLSFPHAHRKLTGESKWDLAQIRKVGEYFGESFAYLTASLSPLFAANGNLSDGVLFINEKQIPCLIAIGTRLNSALNQDYVGVKDEGAWNVVDVENIPENTPYYKINQLIIKLQKDPDFSVAVLDDDQTLAGEITEYLNHAGGFMAESFYSDDILSKALSNRSFDGYIIDWHLSNRTAESIIRAIRQKDATQPIFLLTGQIETGFVSEDKLSKIVSLYDLIMKEKPTRMSIIAAELMRILEKRHMVL